MPATNQVKFTIGGPEVTPGTAVARTHVIPIASLPDYDNKVTKIEDPVITGKNMVAGMYPVAEDLNGKLPLSPRPCGAIGKLLRSILGDIVAPVQVGACIRVRYTGALASCKLVASNANNSLTSNIGARGAESPDAAFGATGVIDFDETAYDTLAEVIAAIEGYTDYECQKVFGPNSLALGANKVEAIVQAEGKSTWCYVWFLSATSGVYRHTFRYQTGIAEHAVYTVQRDGFGDNYLGDGNICDAFSMSGALQAEVKGDCTLMGMKETAGQAPSTLDLEDVDPMIFGQGSTTIAGDEHTYVREMSIQIEAGHRKDGYGQGALTRAYHEKGKFKAGGKFGLRIDANVHAFRAKVKTGDRMAVALHYWGKALTPDINEMMIVEEPYCSYDAYDYKDNSGCIDVDFAYTVLYPKGVLYNNPITFHLLMTESAQL